MRAGMRADMPTDEQGVHSRVCVENVWSGTVWPGHASFRQDAVSRARVLTVAACLL